jgi:enoyl-CoA hydratase/carnithine racemase
MTTYNTVLLDRRGHVGWLTLNRPAVLNAHDLTMLDELPQAWDELAADNDVRVIVMTGAGRGFCTGADVKEVAASGSMGDRMAKRDRSVPRRGVGPRANNVWKPVIVAVNGVCAGGGLHFVAEADVVIASSAATFVDTHVTVGQVAGLEPIGLLGRMPFGSVMRMALVGTHERISAQRAYELGLVSEIAEPDRLQDAAQELAELIARNSPSALMATKHAIWNAREMHRAEALDAAMADIEAFWGHPDNREGPAAFAEKRTPQWAEPSLTFKE